MVIGFSCYLLILFVVFINYNDRYFNMIKLHKVKAIPVRSNSQLKNKSKTYNNSSTFSKNNSRNKNSSRKSANK